MIIQEKDSSIQHRATVVSTPFALVTEQGELHGQEGDVLVCHEDGSYGIIKQDNLKEAYDVIEPNKPGEAMQIIKEAQLRGVFGPIESNQSEQPMVFVADNPSRLYRPTEGRMFRSGEVPAFIPMVDPDTVLDAMKNKRAFVRHFMEGMIDKPAEAEAQQNESQTRLEP